MLVAEYAGNAEIRVNDRAVREPASGEVQIEVAYVGICGTDLHIRHGAMDRRVSIPSPIGHEMSGTITALGEGVSGLVLGQAVTVMPLQWCGACPACLAGHNHICQNLVFVGVDSAGAMQQRWNVDHRIVVPLPSSLKLDEAALTEPLAVAVHDVRRARVLAGESVLVAGGGPIGLLIALVAKAQGADVIVSEPNGFRRSIAERLGVGATDPLSTDVLDLVVSRTDGAGVDVAFEVSGTEQGLSTATHALRVRGRLVVVAIHTAPVLTDMFRVFWRELEVVGARVYEREDFEAAVRLLAEGRIPARELISAVEPLARTAAAFDTLETGGDVLKVLIDVQA
jgi:2-desacetyl-2-hydroxyethyl bacteriochlorophyllide A dehydrogenase